MLLGGNSLSDLLVFGKRAGEYAALFAKQNSSGRINEDEIKKLVNDSTKPFENTAGENPYQVQYDLQEMMQDLVGIVRNEDELQSALIGLKKLSDRAKNVQVIGNREYNNGWHTALDLKNLMTVSEAITLSAIQRKESRGAHFREDFPDKNEQSGRFNSVIRKSIDGEMEVTKQQLVDIRPDLKEIIVEMK